jgi:putative component of membrane protein insertase Oxa1/YidC/SpoIIIJ protein YidD
MSQERIQMVLISFIVVSDEHWEHTCIHFEFDVISAIAIFTNLIFMLTRIQRKHGFITELTAM